MSRDDTAETRGGGRLRHGPGPKARPAHTRHDALARLGCVLAIAEIFAIRDPKDFLVVSGWEPAR